MQPKCCRRVGNETARVHTLGPTWRVPRAKALLLRRNSGWQKNSGVSSLTSLLPCRQFCQAPGRLWNSRSAWSNLPPCAASSQGSVGVGANALA